MIPAVLAVIGGVTIPILDVSIPAYENSLRWTAPVVGVWLLIGILVYFYLRSQNPRGLEGMNAVYGGEELSEE
jgi:hypothetical protein